MDLLVLCHAPSLLPPRDRMGVFWKDLSLHLSRIIASAGNNHFLLERGVVSVMHLALRLLGRGEFPIIQVSFYYDYDNCPFLYESLITVIWHYLVANCERREPV